MRERLTPLYREPKVVVGGGGRPVSDGGFQSKRAVPACAFAVVACPLTDAYGRAYSWFLTGFPPSPYTIAVLVVPSLIQSAQSSCTDL